MRFKPVAYNNTIIIKKDRSYLKDNPNLISQFNYKSETMKEMPEPYTGIIDSIGSEQSEFKVGEHVAFDDLQSLYLEFEDEEYVVVTPEMIIGILKNGN